ncbi:MAG: DUF4292 domain-containing protein [Mangrovibacterium sp.]
MKRLALFAIVLSALASCKTAKTVTSNEKLRPISTNRLIKNMEENTFDYEGLDIKRINCTYETTGNRTSFRATLTSRYNKDILVSISKLNLSVARLYLTPDSVKMVNYLQKTYFMGDYSYLERAVGIKIDFQLVQSILKNDPFSYRKDEKDYDYREFESYADSGAYVLQSLKNRKLEKISRKNKEEKVDRYLRKLDEDNFIVQSLFVDPVTYKIRKIQIDDKFEGRVARVDFDEFTAVDNQLYPGSIELQFKSPENDIRLSLKLSRFSLDPSPEINFSIPERYKPANP